MDSTQKLTYIASHWDHIALLTMMVGMPSTRMYDASCSRLSFTPSETTRSTSHARITSKRQERDFMHIIASSLSRENISRMYMYGRL